MPQDFIVKLQKKETVAKDTLSFFFNKPDGFDYQAGQNADFTLINPSETDTEGNKRTFSFSSSPDETELVWTTRMRDTAYKRTLQQMPIGTEIEMKGPYGDMTLHNRFEKPAIFIAGGIGIAPFFSMIKYATTKQLPHKIMLFYSNRKPEDAAFLNELTNLEKLNKNLKLIPTMTQMDLSQQPWHGETGYITSDLLKKYISIPEGPIYYLAGPPAMLASMSKVLTLIGVNNDDIRSEEFSGY